MQNKTSIRPAWQPLASALRQARQAKGWSQRELSARAHMPQAQISRIETGEVDPQVSTLVELARTLDLDLQLVPRSALTAVEAAVRSAEERSEERASRELLTKLLAAAQEARAFTPEREDIASIQASLSDIAALAPTLRGPVLLDELQSVLVILEHFVVYPPAERGSHAKRYGDAARFLKDLRNQLAHTPPAERPAYSLDDED